MAENNENIIAKKLEEMKTSELKDFYRCELVSLHSLNIYAAVVNSFGDLEKANIAIKLLIPHQNAVNAAIKELSKRAKNDGQKLS